jgi:hypothetical protein
MMVMSPALIGFPAARHQEATEGASGAQTLNPACSRKIAALPGLALWLPGLSRQCEHMATLVNLVLACGAALTAVSNATCARAQDSPDFYKGKTVSLYVGSTTGGVYDVYARLLARHMGQHIPGNPKILPLNMDGAGGLRLANFLYNAAPKDGTPADLVAKTKAMLK